MATEYIVMGCDKNFPEILSTHCFATYNSNAAALASIKWIWSAEHSHMDFWIESIDNVDDSDYTSCELLRG